MSQTYINPDLLQVVIRDMVERHQHRQAAETSARQPFDIELKANKPETEFQRLNFGDLP